MRLRLVPLCGLVAPFACLPRSDRPARTTPQNCKISQYPRLTTAQGRICGTNTISVDVPLNGGFGVGVPVSGKTLYNVTAFGFGRNDDTTDIYDDVDATHSFDYALGGATGGAAC